MEEPHFAPSRHILLLEDTRIYLLFPLRIPFLTVPWLATEFRQQNLDSDSATKSKPYTFHSRCVATMLICLLP